MIELLEQAACINRIGDMTNEYKILAWTPEG